MKYTWRPPVNISSCPKSNSPKLMNWTIDVNTIKYVFYKNTDLYWKKIGISWYKIGTKYNIMRA